MEEFIDKKRIHSWKKEGEECDQIFEAFPPHYKNMLDGEDKVKHFCMKGRTWDLKGHVDEIREEIRDDIQQQLIPWIKNEFKYNDLTNKKRWRPVRDFYFFSDIFLGYKKLFQYKHYLFQLILLVECDGDDDTSICKYCENKEHTPHFGVMLFGWRDINYEKLQPENTLTVFDDNMIPKSYWDVKI